MTSIVVLNTVYKDAIINREKILSILKGPKFEQILQKTQDIRLMSYKLKKKRHTTYGEYS